MIHKVVIVGAGAVGSTFAYALAQDGSADQIVLTVSAMLTGEFGIEDACLGVPCVISSDGIERIVQGKLTEEETDGLRRSATVLKEAWMELKPA